MILILFLIININFLIDFFLWIPISYVYLYIKFIDLNPISGGMEIK